MKKLSLAVALTAALVSGSAMADQVAANVNGKKIMMSEVEEFYKATPQFRAFPINEVYPVVLDNLIATQLVMDAAVKDGMLNDAQVKKDAEEYKKIIAGRYYMKKKMDAMMTKKKLEEMFAEYKKKNPDKEEVRARHILVDTEKEAKDIIAKLKKGEKFADLADKYSKDKAAKGGDLDYFTKDVMVKEFADEAFKLKKGAYTQKPVKTEFGYHVILVEDKRMSNTTYKDIEPLLKAQFIEENAPVFLKGLVDKAKVERFGPDGKPLKDSDLLGK